MDYSKTILDWLNNSKDDALEKWEYIIAGELQQKQKALLGSEEKQQLPKFKSLDMQTTRFCDLRFRLGAGYTYCHQVCVSNASCLQLSYNLCIRLL